MPPRIVITGGSGILATNWAYLMRQQAQICLFTHRHIVNISQVESKQVSLDDINVLKKALNDWEAELVIHTAGLTNVDECERNPELARVVNVDIAANVARAAKDLGIRLVHISTDHLFQGDKPLVDENEPPNPINIYGKTKLEAEQRVLGYHPDALVVRTNFYGWGHTHRRSFSDWIIRTLSNGQKTTVFHDVYYTPILIDDLVIATHRLVNKCVSGILNIVASERISKYEFALAIADEFELDKRYINKGSIEDATLLAPRPKDMSLSNRKAVKILESEIGNIINGIKILHEQNRQLRPVNITEAVQDNH